MATSARERLIETAADLFYRNGFQAIGIDQIIAAVGVTKTTFYNHFPSKDDLILAVIDWRDQLEKEMFTRAMEEKGGACPRARLLALFDVLDAWFNEPEFHGCIFNNVATEFPAPNHPAHHAAAAHKRAFEREILELATQAGADDPLLLTRRLLMLTEGALVMRYVMKHGNAAVIAKATAEMVLACHLDGESNDSAMTADFAGPNRRASGRDQNARAERRAIAT